jgi:hypothetical protein
MATGTGGIKRLSLSEYMKNFYSITVSSFNFNINLEIIGTKNFIDAVKSSKFWYQYIPCFSLNNSKNYNKSNQNTWRIIERLDNRLKYNIKSKLIFCDYKHIIELVVIIESVFEKIRQENELYTMHGSCISKNKKSICFIGNISGIGKTSSASYSTNDGWLWHTDEKFTISKDLNIIGGTSGILDDEKTHKAASLLRPVGINHPINLFSFIIPIIVDSARDYETHELNREKKLWVFYEELTRGIRNSTGYLNGFDRPLESLDTNTVSSSRYDFANFLTEKVTAHIFKGTRSQILGFITKVIH